MITIKIILDILILIASIGIFISLHAMSKNTREEIDNLIKEIDTIKGRLAGTELNNFCKMENINEHFKVLERKIDDLKHKKAPETWHTKESFKKFIDNITKICYEHDSNYLWNEVKETPKRRTP